MLGLMRFSPVFSSPVPQASSGEAPSLKPDSLASVRRRTASIFESSLPDGAQEGSTPEIDISTTHYSSSDASPVFPRKEELRRVEEDFQRIMVSGKQEIERAVAIGQDPTAYINRCKLMCYEIISKVLAYDLLNPSETVKIPVFVNGQFEIRWFEPTFINLVDGNGAYLFIPRLIGRENSIPPLLVFRGTDAKHSFGSLRADLGFRALTSHLLSCDILPPIDVGRTVVERDGTHVQTILRAVHAKYGKLILMGHSLGGKVASSFSIDKENYDFVKEVYTFHSPGVTKSELAKYESLPQEKKFSATACTIKSDLIGNGIGHKRFFGKKFILDPKELPLSLAEKHTRCVISQASNIRCITADHRPMTTQRKIKRILKYATLVPIALAIISRLGYFFFALTIEFAYICGLNNPFKETDQNSRIFLDTLYFNFYLRKKENGYLETLKSGAQFYYQNRVNAQLIA